MRIRSFVRAGIALAVPALVVALTPAPAAHAQTATPPKATAPATKPAPKPPAKKKGEASLGAGTATGKLLTRQELRECIARRDALRTTRTDVEQRNDTLKRDLDALNTESAQLKTERETLDLTSADGVAAYNARVEARNGRIDAWDARNADLRKEADALNTEQSLWDLECGNRRYREEDEIALRKGK
jgi:cell division protein FtsB